MYGPEGAKSAMQDALASEVDALRRQAHCIALTPEMLCTAMRGGLAKTRNVAGVRSATLDIHVQKKTVMVSGDNQRAVDTFVAILRAPPPPPLPEAGSASATDKNDAAASPQIRNDSRSADVLGSVAPHSCQPCPVCLDDTPVEPFTTSCAHTYCHTASSASTTPLPAVAPCR
jgi:hypothetical protein